MSFAFSPRLKALLLVAIAFAAYLPVFHAGFVWDDSNMLTQNALIRSADGLRRIWCSAENPDYFPLTSTSLWVEWRFWGMHPLGYHLANLALHIAGSLLFWRVLQRLKSPGAWIAALVFAVHPVNVESVAWITERKNTLSFLFYAASALCFLRHDRTESAGNTPHPFSCSC